MTEQLYEVLLSQAQIFLEQATISKSAVFDSLKRMETDLEELFTTFPEMKDRKEALVNILEAFVFYRPDVGYVKGMCRLVMLVLLYCNEYQTFSCFINLTHSHHFISFFRGIMREVKIGYWEKLSYHKTIRLNGKSDSLIKCLKKNFHICLLILKLWI